MRGGGTGTCVTWVARSRARNPRYGKKVPQVDEQAEREMYDFANMRQSCRHLTLARAMGADQSLPESCSSCDNCVSGLIPELHQRTAKRRHASIDHFPELQQQSAKRRHASRDLSVRRGPRSSAHPCRRCGYALGGFIFTTSTFYMSRVFCYVVGWWGDIWLASYI